MISHTSPEGPHGPSPSEMITIALKGLDQHSKATRSQVVATLKACGLTVNEQAAVLDRCPAQINNIANESIKMTLSFSDKFLNEHAYSGFSFQDVIDASEKDLGIKEREVDEVRRDIHRDRARGLIKIWIKMGLVTETAPEQYHVSQKHIDARHFNETPPEIRMLRLLVSHTTSSLWIAELSEQEFLRFYTPLKHLSETPFEDAVNAEEKELKGQSKKKKKERAPVTPPTNELDAHYGIVGGVWELESGRFHDDIRVKDTLASAVSAQMEGRLRGCITSIYGPMDETGINNLRAKWSGIIEAQKKLSLAAPTRRGPRSKKVTGEMVKRKYVFAYALCLLETPRPLPRE
ncbi:hypothetical protein DES53_11545 [Roseimicrobium gellanilyticum]|uniref:Uncharacterized protein n=1 Tax=Roseimicrobium gellanilyticum TaxID=748857 RepID=A0A366H4G1_9BACT|nr:hypothetical protein [Roseimicrobium gellanilyticum]RBP36904.1 hypothetical protein DES53_11545 [Roseimicrobium gellanilyticum]